MEERAGYRRRLFCTVSVVCMAVWEKRNQGVSGKGVGSLGPGDDVPMP